MNTQPQTAVLTRNPVGKPKVRPSAASVPSPPPEDIQELQDPGHTEADFLRDLEKATRRRDDPSKPARGSSKT